MKVVTWSEAVPIAPVISITLDSLTNFDFEKSATNVIKAIAKYANNLGLLVDLEAGAMLQEVLLADPKFQGRATYYITPSEIEIDHVSFTSDLASDASANLCKTFYSYDDEVNAINEDGIHYENDDGTIRVYFI